MLVLLLLLLLLFQLCPQAGCNNIYGAISYKIFMRKFLEPFNNRSSEANPQNGATRLQKDTNSSLHLQIFFNGSWRHDQNCKLKTNKECDVT